MTPRARDIDCQVEYWSRVGPSKAFSHPLNFERLSAFVTPDAAVLDYGCGYGRLLDALQGRGYRNLLGVDPAPGMIAAARERLPGTRVEELADPPHVHLPDACLDAVLLFSVLTCVPTDRGQRGIVEEVGRLLKPEGLLYISDLWLQTDGRNVERYARGLATYGTYGVFDLAEEVTVRHHRPEWIAALTGAYRVAALDHITVQTMNGHAARGFQWFGRKRGDSKSGRDLS
jgi:SAM-dependent methyltransferase